MGYETYLKDLLRPLGIYQMKEGSLSGEELSAAGRGLDSCAGALDRAEREGINATAEEEGLDRREALFARKNAAPTTELRREAIAALMRIDGDSFTLQAINDTIGGCGIPAQAIELEDRIRIVFPGLVGMPEESGRIEEIILDIIPAHLETEFYYRYLTWAECEAHGYTWAMVEAAGYTFLEFQMAV